MATYFGMNTIARITEKALFIRLKISAKAIPPTIVIVSSPMEYSTVTRREFHRYLVPDPLKSHSQFLKPTYCQVSFKRFQSVKLIRSNSAMG